MKETIPYVYVLYVWKHLDMCVYVYMYKLELKYLLGRKLTGENVGFLSYIVHHNVSIENLSRVPSSQEPLFKNV